MGHFLCLDRWGAGDRSRTGSRHGLARRRPRACGGPQMRTVRTEDGHLVAQMSAELPLAGLKVSRSIRMAQDRAVFAVAEAVTNTRHLGRVYNIVQHPTIGPPFLDESTRVDANGTRGFMQETPHAECPRTPRCAGLIALKKDGTKVDIRHLTGDASPAVVSYIIEEKIRLDPRPATPAKGLLIGYIWPEKEYPWFDAWRHVPRRQALCPWPRVWHYRPAPNLARYCWKRARFSVAISFTISMPTRPKFFTYANFLMDIPSDFAGVADVEYAKGQLVVREDGGQSRELTMEVGELFAW